MAHEDNTVVHSEIKKSLFTIGFNYNSFNHLKPLPHIIKPPGSFQVGKPFFIRCGCWCIYKKQKVLIYNRLSVDKIGNLFLLGNHWKNSNVSKGWPWRGQQALGKIPYSDLSLYSLYPLFFFFLYNSLYKILILITHRKF